MSNISSLIEVFKMDEIKVRTRIKLLKKLGSAINYEFASNVTDEIVTELVQILEERIERYKKNCPNSDIDNLY